ncbi:restriction endonuclease EcoEI subunit M [Desulfosarcina widdelii]|uniref:site-specific DNA-methyltransferase (adenine-specific) n=1 Tax=Desulfosarcina widdelii TaxID=947919 RepID=A0A5K7ZEA6_9BACT|nr:class I SAM-dependent DNA methyltransferase [Desulfosarcina widdelii]BBO74547.1 restriction endonuclease EcoEI subunit M [Desulfosarcina widdelii]
MPRGRKAKKAPQPLTTAQQLGSLIKSARDIMRKDKGLNGDLDRLPLFTWIMFLKFLDDMEQLREQEAQLSGDKYKPDIEKPYRWRDWAAPEDGFTGDDLIRFVNQDEAMRPDGKKGIGLLAYLRSLHSSNGRNRRDVIANVFQGVQNRMVSGYLLRDVINKVNGIHFNSSEEIHTLSHLYETMLREMRDAAGDSGEFYTPRPVVQFMVAVSDPKLGESVLDPACGTGGFLVEAYTHLGKQCHSVKDRHILHERSIYGQEAKPLPYMLCQMNLLLHGLEYPYITYDNSLNVKVQEIGDKDRVDVILTNPPFGGEEETGIKSNFPDDLQTSETALLFLQLHMRLLKRPERNNGKPGRAAVVVPNGTLFGDGVCARIKENLLKEFNLHTIVRLPNGVFAPYTGIPTNLLFFDRSGLTETIWYYEIPLPEGRKNYTKTKPMQFEEFVNCITWFKKDSREENDHAWSVDAGDVLKYDTDGNLFSCNLDQKNPNSAEALEHLPPDKLAANILEKEHRIIKIMEELRTELGKECQ